MRGKLIINPVAGADAGAAHLPLINERLREIADELDIVMTTQAGDGIRAAERAAQDEKCGYIFVGGGDGTLNEALNGAARVPNALERITFGLIPLGTGNDFAVALGLDEEVETTLDKLLQRHTTAVDLCRVNERYFVNVSAGGFIGEVSEAVSPGLKSVAGKLAYLIGGAQALMEYEPVATRVRAVKADGTRFENEMSVQFFAVGNSRLVGGGKEIAPDAVIDDGVFDVCLAHELGTLEFLNLLRQVAAGEHLADERVNYFQARELTLDCAREMKANTDGETLAAQHLTYSIEPRAVHFLCGGELPFSR